MFFFFITFIAGFLTILSPCILPVLPFVFAKGQGSFWRNGFPLLLGMALTFALFSGLALVGGELVGNLNNWGRWISLVLLTFFGLSLIFKELVEKLLTPLTNLGGRIASNRSAGSSAGSTVGSFAGSSGASFGGSVLIGISTGLLWAPCAGPILGLVLTGAASQKNPAYSLFLLFGYSLGSASSLALALVFGGKFSSHLKKFLKADAWIRKALGFAVLAGVLSIAFNLDRTVLTRLSQIKTFSLEQKLLQFAKMPNGNEGSDESPLVGTKAPELVGLQSWLNSKPLNREDFIGKVTLIDFWTYSCINCLRTIPYVQAWWLKYKDHGLNVIGIHTPEFPFERNPENVAKAVTELGIQYPVALDNDYKTWNAFQNSYWPAHYFIDAHGMIRFYHYGEGDYAESEKKIRMLLEENGARLPLANSDQKEFTGIHASSSDIQDLSPETYLGADRAENFSGQPSLAVNTTQSYTTKLPLMKNHWALAGLWEVLPEFIRLKKSKGKISFQFRARDVNLVLGGKQTAFRVKLDGNQLGADHGLDTNEKGAGRVLENRMYQLIRLKEGLEKDHLFEIEFDSPEVEAFAFTFG